jgi:hypothetical protein
LSDWSASITTTVSTDRSRASEASTETISAVGGSGCEYRSSTSTGTSPR